jgi:membrane-associated phospholipid phosphatase
MLDQVQELALELPWGRLRNPARRVLLAILMVSYFVAGQRLIPLAVEGRASTLHCFLDDLVPFWPWTMYLYAFVYTSMLYPLFVVRCDRLFRRVVLAYFAVLTIAFACFLAFPVTAIGLRPAPAMLRDEVFHEWGLKLNYALDPPYNLFPSLHLSIAATAMLSAWKASRRFGVLATPIVAGVGMSIVTVKQHYVVDGLGAIILAAAVFLLVLRPYPTDAVPEGQRSYSWRGPAAYAAFHCLVYLGLFVAFRMGAKAW